jgi:hypothetical protein
MIKKVIYTVAMIGLLFTGCSSKENTNIVTKAKFADVKVGNKLADFTIDDQFDKKHSLTNKTKKIIFAFSKPMGHIVKMYMSDKEKNYLQKRDILFIADVSGMPKIIYNMFALSDMKEANYPMLIILKKENALRFRNEDKKDYIMILTLDNKTITNIKYVNNAKDLKKEID